MVEQLATSLDTKLLEERLQNFDLDMLRENKTSESWFITDACGTQLAHLPSNIGSLGRNYAWRTYFSGKSTDQPDDWRPPTPDKHVDKTQLSAVFKSNSSGVWVVAISTPVYKDLAKKADFLGVIGVSFELKRFVNLADPENPKDWDMVQIPVLVEARQGDHTGLILEHPLFNKLLRENRQQLPKRFREDPKYRVSPEELSALAKDGVSDYHDPIGNADEGEDYRKTYLAAQSPIEVLQGSGRDATKVQTGWVVIVEDPYQLAIGDSLTQLADTLLGKGLIGLGVIGVVIVGMWWLVLRMLEKPASWKPQVSLPTAKSAETISSTN